MPGEALEKTKKKKKFTFLTKFSCIFIFVCLFDFSRDFDVVFCFCCLIIFTRLIVDQVAEDSYVSKLMFNCLLLKYEKKACFIQEAGNLGIRQTLVQK